MFFRYIGDEFFMNGGFDTGCEGVRDQVDGWQTAKRTRTELFRVLD